MTISRYLKHRTRHQSLLGLVRSYISTWRYHFALDDDHHQCEQPVSHCLKLVKWGCIFCQSNRLVVTINPTNWGCNARHRCGQGSFQQSTIFFPACGHLMDNPIWDPNMRCKSGVRFGAMLNPASAVKNSAMGTWLIDQRSTNHDSPSGLDGSSEGEAQQGDGFVDQ